MNWIDAHSHITDQRAGNLDRLLLEAERLGIRYHLQGGVGPLDWQKQRETSLKDPRILPAFGLHPYWISENEREGCEQALDLLAKLLPEATILGEAGLDFREKILIGRGGDAAESQPPEIVRARQLDFFAEQLELAEFTKKPICLHVVRAFDEALRLVEFHRGNVRGFVHAFSGSWEQARQWIELGFSISIGASSIKSSAKLRKAVSLIPVDFLLIETDSPDQKPPDWPKPFNEPASLIWVAKEVANLRGLSFEEVLDSSRQNLENLIGKGWFHGTRISTNS